MSGHSHWSTIKRQKQAQDAKKGQIFGKLMRQITLAAQKGGVDPQTNPKLRLAIEQAKKQNMPAEKIERAIAKLSGMGQGSAQNEMTIEGYGPAGVAILIKAVSDNKNRTLAEIKHILQAQGGRVGEPGSAAFVFDKTGQPSFTVPIEGKNRLGFEELLSKLKSHPEVRMVWSNPHD